MKRTTFTLLVLFAGCQPHFQSGKTQCSDKGECPGGYICSDDGSGSNTCITKPTKCLNTAAFYCAQSNTCWENVVLCSTVFNCGTTASPNNRNCPLAGYHPDCNSAGCLPDSIGTGGSGGGSGGTGGTGPGAPDASLLDAATPDLALPQPLPDATTPDLRVPDTATPDTATPDAPTPDAPAPDTRVPDAATPDLRAPDANLPVCPKAAAGGICSIFPACGCSTGQVCSPDQPATGLGCFATSNLAEGMACTGSACMEGLGCAGGVCRKYCQSAADCTAVDSARSCLQTYWLGTTTPIPGLAVCARVCDPVSPQNPRGQFLACPAGTGCLSAAGSPGASNCISQPGTGIANTPCSQPGDCSPGFFCNSDWGACAKFCYTNADCAIGYTCFPFSTPQYAGTTQVGYCD